VKFQDRLSIVLGAVALGLVVVQFFRPLGNVRIPPGILLLFVLIVLLRQAVRRQGQKRTDVLKEVQKRPLGLSDE
jgi:hypothetical protein